MHEITEVKAGSPARRHGVRSGDFIEKINGEALIDVIDYQALTATRHVHLSVRDPEGKKREIHLIKGAGQPLGLRLRDSLACQPRLCANRCVFCFVDQMPPGMRETLYQKDDDWRLSLMMGNYITLTNISEAELARIIRRKASPLYISVHATDPAVRSSMMGNRAAGALLSKLLRLKEAGISFHAQIVLCPGINDGRVLSDTLADLLSLHPAALSVALVPVGLTRHRRGLPELSPFSRSDALAVLERCRGFQARALEEAGTRFVFPADELLCLAGAEIPGSDEYEGYPQLQNGVGMIRAFEEELRQAHQDSPLPARTGTTKAVEVLVPCGTSIAPTLQRWSKAFAPPGISVRVTPITNHFFGETVTVSGLLTGRDLETQLSGLRGDLVLLPDVMLNYDKTLFLDDRSPEQLAQRLGMRLEIIESSGAGFYAALCAAVTEKPCLQGDCHAVR